MSRMSVLKPFEVHIGIGVCTFMYQPGEIVQCSVFEQVGKHLKSYKIITTM